MPRTDPSAAPVTASSRTPASRVRRRNVTCSFPYTANVVRCRTSVPPPAWNVHTRAGTPSTSSPICARPVGATRTSAFEIDPDGGKQPRRPRSHARAEHPASRGAGTRVDQIRHRIAREAVHDTGGRHGCGSAALGVAAEHSPRHLRRIAPLPGGLNVQPGIRECGRRRPAVPSRARGLRPAGSPQRRDARIRTPRDRSSRSRSALPRATVRATIRRRRGPVDR